MSKLSSLFLGAAVLMAVNASLTQIASAADVNLLRQGFCVAKSATGCGEVVLPGTMIEITRLPKLPDGTRVLYFYSGQTISAKTTFVHFLESEDVGPHVDYIFPEGARDQGAAIKNSLKALVKKLAPEGGVVVTPFRLDAVPAGQSITTSYIPVTGPGTYSAKVVDLKGDLVPASQPISVNIIQRQ